MKTARLILDNLENCEASIKSDQKSISGTLTLNLPIPYGRLYVQPHLSEFCKTYPNINLNIYFSDDYLDIIEHGFDITIRAGNIQDSLLIGKKLSPLRLIICASQDYINQHGKPTNLEETHNHEWIRLRLKQSGKLLPVVMPNEKLIREIDPGQKIVVDNGESLAELCVNGLGISQLPHFSAKRWIDSGDLIPLFPSIESPNYAIYLLYIKQTVVPAKVRIFIDFLQEKLRTIGDTPEQTWADTLIF